MDFRPVEIERSSRQNRRRPIHGPPPPKTTLAAALMLVGGLILLAVGLGLRYDKDPKENERGLAMMILGCIIFIPGSYACVQLYGAWMGWPGYHYNNLPSYDD